MVRPVTSSITPHPANRPAVSQPTQEIGKSSDSVGHRAKAAIAQATAEGQELPKNIQGKVASALARGLSIETILNLQDASAPVDDTIPVVDDPIAGDPVADEPIVDEPVGDVVIDDPVIEEPLGDPVLGDPVVEAVADEPVVEVVPDELVTELPDPETAVLDSVLDDLVVDSEEAETA